MLGLWASNLDPLKYRKLYVKKVNLEAPPILQQNKFLDGQTNINLTAANFSRQSNEDIKLSQQYQDHDIVGLSIIEVSGKYKTKFNTLRTHLSWPDHPIVNIMQIFREKLIEYLTGKTKMIKTGAKFYEKQNRIAYTTEQNKKLLEFIVAEIKRFVSLIHNAVIRFY